MGDGQEPLGCLAISIGEGCRNAEAGGNFPRMEEKEQGETNLKQHAPSTERNRL